MNCLKVSLGVKNGQLICYTGCGWTRDPPLMTHSIHLISRPLVIHGSVTTFGYFLRDLTESILYCYLFQTLDPDKVRFKLSTYLCRLILKLLIDFSIQRWSGKGQSCDKYKIKVHL